MVFEVGFQSNWAYRLDDINLLFEIPLHSRSPPRFVVLVSFFISVVLFFLLLVA